MSVQFTFHESAKRFVLGAFGKDVDKEGYIIEKNCGTRVLTPRGEEIHIRDFAGFRTGFRKGSAVVVKSDIVSLVEAARALSPE